jgi:membrane-associated phospholipid phosphatase
MNAWRIYLTGTVIILISGVALTFPGDKAYFLKWLTTQRNPAADYYFYYITRLGEEYGFVVIGLMLWLRSWRRMVVIPILGGIVMLLSFILKELFEEERPLLYLRRTGWDGPMAVLDYHLLSGHASFPSGHSMAAWALFTLTAALIRKTWVSLLCLFLAVSVSISRVYLMAHFLRDVIAGAAIGFALGIIIYYAYDKWLNKKHLEELFPASKT